MKKIYSLIALLAMFVATVSVSAQTVSYIKLRPESGWRLDSNGNIPTLTLTVCGVNYIGTPASQTASLLFTGTFPLPPTMPNYYLTDNEFRHYLFSSYYEYYGGNIANIYVYCIDP